MTNQSAGKTAHRGRTVSAAEFARMWADKRITARKIAEALNISVQAVRSRAVCRSLPPRDGGGGVNRKLDPVLFREMWDANVSANDIAAHFGLKHSNSICNRARLWGFPKRRCTRWNAIPAAEYFMSRALVADADTIKAQWAVAEMVDRLWAKKDPAHSAPGMQ